MEALEILKALSENGSVSYQTEYVEEAIAELKALEQRIKEPKVCNTCTNEELMVELLSRGINGDDLDDFIDDYNNDYGEQDV